MYGKVDKEKGKIMNRENLEINYGIQINIENLMDKYQEKNERAEVKRSINNDYK